MIYVRLKQFKKVAFPIFVTNGGMVMLVRLEQGQNVLLVDYQYYTL